jgi:hypothetical protein
VPSCNCQADYRRMLWCCKSWDGLMRGPCSCHVNAVAVACMQRRHIAVMAIRDTLGYGPPDDNAFRAPLQSTTNLRSCNNEPDYNRGVGVMSPDDAGIKRGRCYASLIVNLCMIRSGQCATAAPQRDGVCGCGITLLACMECGDAAIPCSFSVAFAVHIVLKNTNITSCCRQIPWHRHGLTGELPAGMQNIR